MKLFIHKQTVLFLPIFFLLVCNIFAQTKNIKTTFKTGENVNFTGEFTIKSQITGDSYITLDKETLTLWYHNASINGLYKSQINLADIKVGEGTDAGIQITPATDPKGKIIAYSVFVYLAEGKKSTNIEYTDTETNTKSAEDSTDYINIEYKTKKECENLKNRIEKAQKALKK